jgi:microcystin-dependent protein
VARCNCSETRCSCVIIAGPGASVEGAGRADNPYIISGGGGEGGGGGWESGDIKTTARSSPAPGWLVCNGAAVSRATYPALFAAIGAAYGAGDGATTFNLPDYTKRFVMGAGGEYPRGVSGGAAALTTDHLPSHTHAIDHTHAATSSSGVHDHELGRASSGGSGSTIPEGSAQTSLARAGIADDGAHTHTVPKFMGDSGATGAATPADFLPPFATALIVIKT